MVIDLVGYRRWGHNEGDEPSYTQPLMYAKIKSHTSVAELYGEQLVRQGVVTAAELEALWAREEGARCRSEGQRRASSASILRREPVEHAPVDAGGDVGPPARHAEGPEPPCPRASSCTRSWRRS